MALFRRRPSPLVDPQAETDLVPDRLGEVQWSREQIRNEVTFAHGQLDQAACTPRGELPELRRRLRALSAGPALDDDDRPYNPLSSGYGCVRLLNPFETPSELVGSEPLFALPLKPATAARR